MRAALEAVIEDIEADPAWGATPTRFLAPADSPHTGYIVDLSARGYAVIYRIVDRGAAVEVALIQPVIF